ncbi:MAG: PTS sugar transporter subunit IIA [Rhodopirellula sp.]|nr:PTS sugar transporter subunit IIA [Rhodopirellula sp.]
MELTLNEVAKIFDVAERKILLWIRKEDLPAMVVSDQYRFNRADLLEWAALRQKPFSPSIYLAANGDLAPSATRLADALERGGVLNNVGGTDLRQILRTALSGLPIPEALGLDNLVDLIAQRDDFGCLAIGHGIAIPHPRRPIILDVPGPHVRLCYLSEPLPLTGPDGRRVDKLIVMLSPTAHEHLQLLARLGAVLQVEAVRNELEGKAGLEQLCATIRAAGQHFHHPETEMAHS